MIRTSLATVALFTAVAASAAPHSVSFTAVATGVTTNVPLEFVFCGPDSDRAYESMFVLETKIGDVAKAFDAAGFPRGKTTDAKRCRFWPAGHGVTIKPDLHKYIVDNREKMWPRLIYTGGKRLADGSAEAEKEMPASLLSLYTHAQPLITFDGIFEQSQIYGRFNAAKEMKKGDKVVFTVTWDGKPGYDPVKVKFNPGDLKTPLTTLAEKAKRNAIDVEVELSEQLSINEAIAIAKALTTIDSPRVKINGFVEGQLFYRAFMPLEKWRDRKERLVQPLEISVGATNVFTVVDEDWNVEGNDPKLTARTVDQPTALKFSGDTCFFYAKGESKLGALYAIKKLLPANIVNFYVYPD